MCPEHDAEECCDFLLATRIRYESRSRVVPAAREAEEPPPPPEMDVRAAEFLLATRSHREATERAAAEAARRR